MNAASDQSEAVKRDEKAAASAKISAASAGAGASLASIGALAAAGTLVGGPVGLGLAGMGAALGFGGAALASGLRKWWAGGDATDAESLKQKETILLQESILARRSEAPEALQNRADNAALGIQIRDELTQHWQLLFSKLSQSQKEAEQRNFWINLAMNIVMFCLGVAAPIALKQFGIG